MKNLLTKYDLVDFFSEIEKKKANSNGSKISFSDTELSLLFDQQKIEFLEDSINNLSFDYGISAEWQFEFDEISDVQTSWLTIYLEDRLAYSNLIDELLPHSRSIDSYIYKFDSGFTIDTINNSISFGNKSFDLRFGSDSGIFLLALLEASPYPVSVADLYALMGGSAHDTNKSYKIGEARKYLRQRMLSELEINPNFFDQLIRLVPGDGYKIDLPFKKTK